MEAKKTHTWFFSASPQHFSKREFCPQMEFSKGTQEKQESDDGCRSKRKRSLRQGDGEREGRFEHGSQKGITHGSSSFVLFCLKANVYQKALMSHSVTLGWANLL